MDIDIVILSYNTLELTQALYQQVQDTAPEANIVIVDNGSTDGSQEWLKRLRKPKIALNESNLGFSTGCNMGAILGDAEYICFLNSDVKLTDGWLEGTLEAFEDVDVVIAGPQLVKPDGKESRYNFVSGAAMVVLRHWFFEAGMFDEDYFFAWEDVDLSRVAEYHGKKTATTQPSILHLGRQSHGEDTQGHIDAGKVVFDTKWSEVVLTYVGGGRFIMEVPARDLTRLDMIDLQNREPESRQWTVEQLLETGLYKRA